MIQVVKRDGEAAEFCLKKITEAIKKAFKATGKEYNDEILELLSLRVTADFQPKMQGGSISVEEIQDSVEHVLEQTGYTEVAKAYILYRKQREKIRNMNSTILNYKDVVNSYVKAEDWRVRENSTVTYSVGGLILSNSGAVTANYWLSEIYDPETAAAHRNADIHIHDLSMLTGYCAGWSLKQLLMEGLGGITGKITSTHFGITGPLVLSASIKAGKLLKKTYLSARIDLKPALSREQLDARLLREFENGKNKQFKNVVDGMFPAKLLPVILEIGGIAPQKKIHEITRREREAFIEKVKSFPMTVTGLRGFQEAIITQGGISVKEVDPKTMESKKVKGLYFAGEVLDLDALTGGYNLQIAWSTAHAAALAASEEQGGF